MHPIDKEILRALSRTRISVTPSQIAKAIGTHPTTVQRRIEALEKKRLAKCQKRGNRTMCKINLDGFQKQFQEEMEDLFKV